MPVGVSNRWNFMTFGFLLRGYGKFSSGEENVDGFDLRLWEMLFSLRKKSNM
jgi:hypothetical protein